ncbi:MAG: hypothetical protein HYU69_10765 [Bacteroidetes bacterium]|nr:hypothetical protein [Bacteroidota bacterium]
MKKILIIYPHWPPSNLAGVHRPRLIANFIHEFGWLPVILTVDPKFYEERPDPDIVKTVSPAIEINYVSAFNTLKRFRFFGDIGIRAFGQLYKKAIEITKKNKIDFIWIPIPSFYTAVLGRLIYEKTGINYGIDYIDPWVNGFTNYDLLFSKAWLSNNLAKLLEPYAVKKASLISGVATSYYRPVLDRNFKNKTIEHIGMPYGFDPHDHEIKIEGLQFPWNNIPGCIPLVYAGAFLPKSHLFIELLFKSIAKLKMEGKWNKNIHLYFLGTGIYPGKTITDHANENKVSDSIHEIPERFPFIHILNFLSASSGVMVIGSIENHYTASKIFQSLLSKKPVFAVFHKESSVVSILKQAEADNYLCEYTDSMDVIKLEFSIYNTFDSFVKKGKNWIPKLETLNHYSSRQSAFLLAQKLDLITFGK